MCPMAHSPGPKLCGHARQCLQGVDGGLVEQELLQALGVTVDGGITPLGPITPHALSKSVRAKSSPVNSNGSPVSLAVAYVMQSPKFSPAGCRPLP